MGLGKKGGDVAFMDRSRHLVLEKVKLKKTLPSQESKLASLTPRLWTLLEAI
jgi:hypothetical protein